MRWARILSAAVVVAATAGCGQLDFAPFSGSLFPTLNPPASATAPTSVPIAGERGSGKLGVTIVMATNLPQRAALEHAVTSALGDRLELTFADLPNLPPEVTGTVDVEARLARARKAYIGADFTPCLDQVGDDALVPDLLGHGHRLLAARVLFWRIACRVGTGTPHAALADARAFATLRLEVPPDVEATAPDVEAVLADAERAADDAARVSLVIDADSSTGAHTVVALDGRENQCATPCTLDVPPGDHVVRVEADGFAPDWRLVRATVGGVKVGFNLSAAPSELAARQWTAHYAQSASIDSPPSLAVRAAATHSRNLVVITADPTGGHTFLRAVLALDGSLTTRAERAVDAGNLDRQAPALLRDLLERGQLLEPPAPLWKRPLFWTAVGVAAAAAVGITALILYQPPVHTTVSF